MNTEPVLTISLREARLILERLVQAAGAPPGMLISARDVAVAVAVATPAGFAAMPEWIAALRNSFPRPLAITKDGDTFVVDCGGQHAFYCAEALLDLAVDADRRNAGAIRASGIGAPSALAALTVLAERHGYDAELTEETGAIAIGLRPRRASKRLTLDRIRLEGHPVPAKLWWQLYEGALDALAPDSFESRRHAGTVRVEADGRLVGRNDEDETDLSMLTADATAIRPASATPPQG